MRTVFVGFACMALTTAAFADPRDFSVDVKPIFQSTFSWSNAPVAVEIENRGPDAKGQLLATDEGTTTRYPVELPTGSKKRIVTYPGGNPYGMTPELFLDTDEGRFNIPYTVKNSYSYGNMAIVALISDNAGDLGFLKQGGENERAQYGDAYCTPEDAPERPAGYQGLAMVILGQGSERLSDRAVKALHTYALTGGTLLFVGGASATVLQDPRWASVIPASGFQTRVIPGSSTLSTLGGFPLGESITLATGKPVPEASVRSENKIPLVAERAYGIGRAVLFAFNPFEEPMTRWGGKRRLFSLYARGPDYQRASVFLNQFDGSASDPYGSYSYYSSGSAWPTGSAYEQRNDPFSVELPRPAKVFWILAAFFVVVVPVNFIILRKLGKGEWAWVTAPVISLTFAGIFLNQASDLYSAKLSTATSGILIAQEGAPEAMFVGSTQIFFPNGGSYDLKMENVDQLSTAMDYGYGYARNQQRSQVNPVDVGSIKVPDLRAANLAFEEIGYRQRLDQVPKLQIRTRTAPGYQQIIVTVKNLSSGDFRNAAIVVAGRRYGLQPLSPGAEQSLQVSTNVTRVDANRGGDFLESFSSKQKVVVFVSDLQGLRPGPQIGQNVAGRSSLRFVYVAPREEPKA